MGFSQYSQNATIRELISKRYLKDQDIQKIINLISTSHISVFKTLSQFFINIRNQLIHNDYISRSFHIQDQRFQSLYLRCTKKMLADLADIIHQKISLYTQQCKELFNTFSPQNQSSKPNQSNFSKKQKIIRNIYPQAYYLQKTIHSQLSFMKKHYQTKPDTRQIKQTDFLKDKLALKIQSQLEEYDTVINSIFNKQYFYQLQDNKFTDQQFYDLKQHQQKVNLLQQLNESPLSQIQKNSKFIEEIHSLPSISAKCACCIPYFYKNRKLPRQRCSLMKIEVVNTLDEKRDLKRLKQLIQTYINSQNGGVIFFDCHDLFFSIKPKGFQCSLKVFQQKKQSLIDICKNVFPDLKINKQFSIDFVLLKDPDVLLGRKKTQQKNKETQMIGRFRILKQNINRTIEVGQDNGKKQIIPYNICKHHYVQKLSKQDLKELQMKRRILNDPDKIEEILCLGNIYNKFQILKYLQGRKETVVIHEGNRCKEKPLQIYDDRSKKRQQNQQNYVSQQQLQQRFQRIQIGKQPLNLTDKNYRFWSLLVVNVQEFQTIDSQLKTLFKLKGSKYDLQAPFQDYLFSQSKKTLLVKTSCSHEQFVNLINSPQAQQQKYLRTHKKQVGYVPLVHIKVYEYIFISLNKKQTVQQLIVIKNKMQQQVKRYFEKEAKSQENKQKRFRCLSWVEQLKIKIYSHQTRPSLYISSNDWNPSYALLFVYYKLKHENSVSKDSNFKKIELKQHKDFSNQKGYLELL